MFNQDLVTIRLEQAAYVNQLIFNKPTNIKFVVQVNNLVNTLGFSIMAEEITLSGLTASVKKQIRGEKRELFDGKAMQSNWRLRFFSEVKQYEYDNKPYNLYWSNNSDGLTKQGYFSSIGMYARLVNEYESNFVKVLKSQLQYSEFTHNQLLNIPIFKTLLQSKNNYTAQHIIKSDWYYYIIRGYNILRIFKRQNLKYLNNLFTLIFILEKKRALNIYFKVKKVKRVKKYIKRKLPDFY